MYCRQCRTLKISENPPSPQRLGVTVALFSTSKNEEVTNKSRWKWWEYMDIYMYIYIYIVDFRYNGYVVYIMDLYTYVYIYICVIIYIDLSWFIQLVAHERCCIWCSNSGGSDFLSENISAWYRGARDPLTLSKPFVDIDPSIDKWDSKP